MHHKKGRVHKKRGRVAFVAAACHLEGLSSILKICMKFGRYLNISIFLTENFARLDPVQMPHPRNGIQSGCTSFENAISLHYIYCIYSGNHEECNSVDYYSYG